MIDMEFSFELRPWEAYLRTKQAGDVISAAQILTFLEGEPEQAAEDALDTMETACMILNITDLPKSFGSGEAALRLRQEAQLAAKPLDPAALEENDPLRLYLEEVAATPACGDEQLLAQDVAAGKKNAELALTNLGLSRVIALAAEHTGYGVLLLDLIQEGSLGLWQAIRNFRGGDYCVFRDRWIRFYIAKAVLMQARNNGTGQKMRRALEDYREVDERLLSDLGRNPTLEEIAEQLHMSPGETATLKSMLDNARLLAQAKKPEDTEEEMEAQEQAVEDTAYFQMRQRISELLSGLSEADAKLLTLRFGLEGGKPLSPEEAGHKLGLTPEEVVTRESAALAKLRKS